MRTFDHPSVWSDPSDLRSLAKRSGLVAARCDVLSRDLPAATHSLWRRRAGEVPEGHLDDYVTLGWMRWSSGALVLTSQGQAVLDQVVAREVTP